MLGGPGVPRYVRKRVRRQVLLFLLHVGYIQQRSRVSRKIGLYLLARYLREAGPESQRDRLRAVLLDLHARQQIKPSAAHDERTVTMP